MIRKHKKKESKWEEKSCDNDLNECRIVLFIRITKIKESNPTNAQPDKAPLQNKEKENFVRKKKKAN